MFFVVFVGLLSLTTAAIVDPKVHHVLGQKGYVNVVLQFSKDPNILAEIKKLAPHLRAFAARNELNNHATKTQKPVFKILDGFKYERFWINNQIHVPKATKELVAALQNVPDIEEIYQEEVILLDPLIEGKQVNEVATISSTSPTYGIQQINADKLWQRGLKGQGVLVGSIDSGVDYNHEILSNNYYGNMDERAFAWFDAVEKRQYPHDKNGHGTHVMGTIAGANGYGVAPEASWMACRGCTYQECSQRSLTRCGEFMACPHPFTGPGLTLPCGKLPAVVANSWGYGEGLTWFNGVVELWKALGIVPVFSLGNSGSEGCGSARSPGDAKGLIGVGSTNVDRKISWYSSRGPSINGDIKPEVSAPGEDVISAWIQKPGEKPYKSLSGTSMACPHVAGAIALLASHSPDAVFSFEKANTLLQSTSSQLVEHESTWCQADEETNLWPNNIFGSGIIDLEAALESLLSKN